MWLQSCEQCSNRLRDDSVDRVQLSDIQIRDPFVLVERGEGAYYLFGSTDANVWAPPGVGFDIYRSTDLIEWDGPIAAFRPPAGFWSPGQYWAPETYHLGDAWFMFATFGGSDGGRGTQVLRADGPGAPTCRARSSGPRRLRGPGRSVRWPTPTIPIAGSLHTSPTVRSCIGTATVHC